MYENVLFALFIVWYKAAGSTVEEMVDDRIDYIREIQLVLPCGTVSEVPKDWR